MILIGLYKKYWQPILVFSILIGLLYLSKRYDESREKIVLTAKISDIQRDFNLNYYYRYKFRYKNKFYYSSKYDDDANEEYIGECFEVLVYIDNPNRSELLIENRVDCALYKKTLLSD
ncbi:hypothetical protein LXD69_04315 [Flavobacterium sediminilitoris]|uniref:DUF3592 domain-containing protein n=1 Tax=Flavobacterium sediminilitoris TaxID=2024526 RepID=A0ABY4HQ76_9FLAO|nr:MULTISPECIES: hypothetical protein [Flavobacterium]UOX34733.1 hypothetical protein LXD69_04315 [Flavobacterium sediminilitoris]